MTGPAANEPLAQYGFLSWLRRGVATQIVRREGDAVNEPRAVVSVHTTSVPPTTPVYSYELCWPVSGPT